MYSPKCPRHSNIRGVDGHDQPSNLPTLLSLTIENLVIHHPLTKLKSTELMLCILAHKTLFFQPKQIHVCRKSFDFSILNLGSLRVHATSPKAL